MFRASRFDELRMSGILGPFDKLSEPRFREHCDLYRFQSLSLSKIAILTYLGQQCEKAPFTNAFFSLIPDP